MKKQNYQIFCDMDGVLTDFESAYERVSGRKINDEVSSREFWEPINKAGLSFWTELKWMSDGKQLWNYIKKHKPKILSAPSRSEDSVVGKKQWVKRELPTSELILRSARNKKEFASPTTILIDDKQENIQDWIDAGGIGILHVNTKNTIDQLKVLKL